MSEGSNVKTINGRRVLVITPGDEYKPKVEGIKDFEASIFADKFQKAATLILEVLRANLKESNQQDYPQHDCGQRVSGISPDYFNNIIVFDGERGSGKTSAVKSILLAFDALRCLKDNELITDYYKEWRELKNGYSYNTSLDVIDPSMFEQNSNIIEVIISRMFKRTMEYLKDPCARTSNSNGGDNKSKLIELFSKVKENLAIMKNGDSINRELGDSSIEILQKLACTSDLKLNLIELIEVYNNFIIGDKTKNVLVLCIDDLDMNIKSGFEMLDQIYKYLIIPNVIIIFGTKMQQLVRIVTDEFSTKAGIKQEEEYTRQMAENYLNKLLSPNHRLKLDYLSEDIGRYTIVIKEKKDAAVDIFGVKVEDIVASQMPYEYLQDSIAKLIYKYTGVEIVKRSSRIHPLVPRTLRYLCQIMTLFFQMKENTEIYNEKNTCFLMNLELFDQYIRQTWVPGNLDTKFIVLFEQWATIHEPDEKKWLIQRLSEYMRLSEKSGEDSGNITERMEFFRNISSITVNASNITLGDMHYFLESCQRYNYTEEIIKPVYAIEQIYMIKLSIAYYQLRNQLINNMKSTIIKEDINWAYHKINMILGGALLSPNEYQLMPTKKDYGRRDYIEIRYGDIEGLISSIINDKKESEDVKLIELCAIEMFYMSIHSFNAESSKSLKSFSADKINNDIQSLSADEDMSGIVSIYLPQLLSNQFKFDTYMIRDSALMKIERFRYGVSQNKCRKVIIKHIRMREIATKAFIRRDTMPLSLQWNYWEKAYMWSFDWNFYSYSEYHILLTTLMAVFTRNGMTYGMFDMLDFYETKSRVKMANDPLPGQITRDEYGFPVDPTIDDLREIIHKYVEQEMKSNKDIENKEESITEEIEIRHYSSIAFYTYLLIWVYFIRRRKGETDQIIGDEMRSRDDMQE